MSYNINDIVTLSGVFLSKGLPADPTTIMLKVKMPDLSTQTSVYGVDANLIRDEEGNYHYDFTATQAGTYFYRWEGTGAIQVSAQAQFTVDAAAA